jgi:hypothetical protein
MALGKRLVGGLPVHLGRGLEIAETKDFECGAALHLIGSPKMRAASKPASAPAQNTSRSRIPKIPQPISTYGQNPLQVTPDWRRKESDSR